MVFWWSSEPRWTWTMINILLSKRSSGMSWLKCLIKSRIRSYSTVWITLSIFQIWSPLRNLCEHPLKTLTDKALLRSQSMNSVNAIRSSAPTWQNSTVTSATLTGMKQLERQLYWQESLLSSVATSFPWMSLTWAWTPWHRHCKTLTAHHDLPFTIVSDWGTQFVSYFWLALCDILALKSDRSSTCTYHF